MRNMGDSVPEGGPSGEMAGPEIVPGAVGDLRLQLPGGWKTYDILYLTAYDPYGRLISTWSWPISRPAIIARRLVDTTGPSEVTMAENDSSYVLQARGVSVSIGKKNGLLLRAGTTAFRNGPLLSAGTAQAVKTVERREGDNLVVEAIYPEKSLCQSVKWTMYPSAWLKMEVRYFPVDYEFDLAGINFSCAESETRGIRWMGDGPYRVWKNRMEGENLGVWNKRYNNTITGEAPYVYPEFKGYFSNFYWMRLETAGLLVTVVCGSEDVFLRLYTPGNPFKTYNVAPVFPGGDISFMQAIPAIGTKSQKPENMGPSGRKNMYYDYGKSKDYAKVMTLYFDFTGR